MKCVCPILASLLFVLLTSFTATAQEGMIVLDNPSFEDMPRHSRAPRFWTNCGFVNESPPDVQPDYTFQVNKSAFQGNTYLGMVTRDNDTWEAVGQLLSEPVQEGTCYEFSIKLARSLSYYSVSRETSQPSNYVRPIKLRIWGGLGMCDKREMLAESPLVENADWQEFKFKLEPSADYSHIILEAFYKTPSLFPYNGNLLLDDASPITVIPCEENLPGGPLDPTTLEPLVISDDPDPVITPVIPTPDPVRDPVATDPPVSKGPTTMFGVSEEELVTGLTVPIEDVQFETNSTELSPSSAEFLDELKAFLKQRPEVVVEIGGHTNSLPDKIYADELSTLRAKAVVDYLKEEGVPAVQLRFKGYGKRFPVASNATEEGRKENQRVEVKIIALIKD